MPFLDLARIGAALLVLFGHVRGLYFVGIADVETPSFATKAFYLATSMQHEAVVLFFVVSGFLIGGPVWDQIGRRTFVPKQYLINRFSRIYIVLLPALILVLALQGMGTFLAGTRLIDERPLLPSGVTAGFTWDQIPCHLLSVQAIACAPWGANPPVWSLGYEWILYLLAPVVVAAVRLPASSLWSGTLLALLAAAISAVSVPDWPLWFGAWAMGAASRRALAVDLTPPKLAIAALALCAAAMVLSRTGVVPNSVTDVAIAVLFATALSSQAIVRIAIAPSISRLAAACSYTLYLIHLPLAIVVGAALQKLGYPAHLAQPNAATYSAFGITIIVAIVSAALFARVTEARTNDFRSWLAARLR